MVANDEIDDLPVNDEVLDGDDYEEIEEQNAIEDSLLFKDGTIWCKNDPNIGVRLRRHNIMRFRPGPKEQHQLRCSPTKTFIIITEMNRHGKAVVEIWYAANPSQKQKVWTDLNATELDAFIGILLGAGYSHNNMQTIKGSQIISPYSDSLHCNDTFVLMMVVYALNDCSMIARA